VVLGLAGPVAVIVATRGAELAATWATYFRWVGEHGRSGWSGGGAELLGRLPDARGGLWLMWAGLGVAGVVALLLNWRRRADGVLLAGVAATMLLFLALGQSATWPGQYWILPVPFLVAAGACLVVRTVEEGALGARLAVGGVVVAQVALGSVVWSAHVARERGAEVANVNARAFAEKNLAAGGVVIGPASIAGGVQAGDKWQFVDARRVGGDRRGAGRFRTPQPGANQEREAEARAGRETAWHDLQARAHGRRSTGSRVRRLRWTGRSTAGRATRWWANLRRRCRARTAGRAGQVGNGAGCRPGRGGRKKAPVVRAAGSRRLSRWCGLCFRRSDGRGVRRRARAPGRRPRLTGPVWRSRPRACRASPGCGRRCR
jgi:hypothetical protein